MLLRNSEWTRRLLGEMCAHAHREDLDAMRMVHLHSYLEIRELAYRISAAGLMWWKVHICTLGRAGCHSVVPKPCRYAT